MSENIIPGNYDIYIYLYGINHSINRKYPRTDLVILLNSTNLTTIHSNKIVSSKSVEIIKIPATYNLRINQTINLEISTKGKGYNDLALVVITSHTMENITVHHNRLYIDYHSFRSSFQCKIKNDTNCIVTILPINIGFTGIYLENCTLNDMCPKLYYRLPNDCLVGILISILTVLGVIVGMLLCNVRR